MKAAEYRSRVLVFHLCSHIPIKMLPTEKPFIYLYLLNISWEPAVSKALCWMLRQIQKKKKKIRKLGYRKKKFKYRKTSCGFNFYM